MTFHRKSTLCRLGAVALSIVLTASAILIKSGAAFGSFEANLRARAGALANTPSLRNTSAFPTLAANGPDVARVEPTLGTTPATVPSEPWSSPSLGDQPLPQTDPDPKDERHRRKITLITLPNGHPAWAVTELTPSATATYAAPRGDAATDLARFALPPILLFVFPTALLAWLYPNPQPPHRRPPQA